MKFLKALRKKKHKYDRSMSFQKWFMNDVIITQCQIRSHHESLNITDLTV